MNKSLTINQKQEIAYTITEFWHTIEFLNQPNFPQESKDDRRQVKKERDEILKEKRSNPKKMLSLFYNITSKVNIENMVKEDDKVFVRHPVAGKECSICIGKLERRECVKKLDEYLKIEKEEIEKDQSKLAIMGLRIDSTGTYSEGSFNISPLLWGIGLIKQYGNKGQKVISIERYKEDLQKYEKLLKQSDCVTNELLQAIFYDINKEFIFPIIGKTCKYEGIFNYYRYIDERNFVKSDTKNEDLSDLSRSFFLKDLLMVKDGIRNGYFGHMDQMQKNIIDYIVAAYEDSDKASEKVIASNKIDIKNDRNALTNWLHASKSPLGKWPSKHVPAFMQQVAVNIEISKKDSLNQIFSVNGPPGTGKTTLLKEIIATNLIERAILLSENEHPDEAFFECKFEDGKLKDKGYDKCYYRYYRLKDEKIKDYGMLVASCNNAAVENITKDLPNGEDLCKVLKGDPQNDSEQKINGVLEIENLFCLNKTEKYEFYKIKERVGGEKANTISEKLPDIYFSWLAHRLLTNDEFKEKPFIEWGMISAPLGKRSNINSFCYHVLNPLIDEFLKNNDKRAERLAQYESRRKEFKKQLKLVERMKNKLVTYSSLEEYYRIVIDKLNQDDIEIDNQLHEVQKDIKVIRENMDKHEEKLKEIEIEYQKKSSSLSKKEQENSELEELKKKCEQSIEEISQRIMQMEDGLKLMDHLYNIFRKKTERVERIEAFKENKKYKNLEFNELEEKIHKANAEVYFLENQKEEAKRNIDKVKDALIVFNDQIQNKNGIVKLLHEKIKKNYEGREHLKKEYQNKLKEAKQEVEVIDEEFWSNFVSDDKGRSTKAQVTNPWISDEFNRAREKLFYLALQLHKEFILSSTACRDNFVNLAMMWQNRMNTDEDLVVYSNRDREQAFPELLNTLFLFTPVISTTFASVQNFLADIKESGKIGNLIIDEAGQAPPQMAIGAFFRCKKAIVVGDPKQVAPVVTDDADHIKVAFSNDIVQPYIDKTISVQEFADKINPYGTVIKDMNGNDSDKWVGCPLIVHRRCISPMFEISNFLSYGDSMKTKTALPKDELCKKFLYAKSVWLDVKGKEINPAAKNHFVREQGHKACEMIKESFKLYNGKPDLYVISPFVSVIQEIREFVKSDKSLMVYGDKVEEWCEENCGTVHKFQGKEAAEVIFLLGCDSGAMGAVRWVKSNIVNVAVTRAKYRLYVIGDFSVWKKSKNFEILSNYVEIAVEMA